MPITNCTRCGELYEEQSDESANDPARVCLTCHHIAKGQHFTDATIDELREGKRPMSKQERAYLLETVPNFEECTHTREELAEMDDANLMTTAMWVWVDYCR
jgi:hypothetical protein